MRTQKFIRLRDKVIIELFDKIDSDHFKTRRIYPDGKSDESTATLSFLIRSGYYLEVLDDDPNVSLTV